MESLAETPKPAFEMFQPVRVKRILKMSLVGGLHEEESDANDPNLYFDSRVVGYDTLGRIQIATEIGDNVHCSEWPWSEDKLQAQPEGKWDWYSDRPKLFVNDDGGYWKNRYWQEVGSKVFFMWEDPTWASEDHYTVGETVRAVIKAPHINHGDWIVSYEKKKKDMWITRVLNERQMWKREE